MPSFLSAFTCWPTSTYVWACDTRRVCCTTCWRTAYSVPSQFRTLVLHPRLHGSRRAARPSFVALSQATLVHRILLTPIGCVSPLPVSAAPPLIPLAWSLSVLLSHLLSTVQTLLPPPPPPPLLAGLPYSAGYSSQLLARFVRQLNNLAAPLLRLIGNTVLGCWGKGETKASEPLTVIK